jgi:hypothetical protein
MSVKKDIFQLIGEYLMGALHVQDTDHPNGIIPADAGLPNLCWFDKQMGQFSNAQTSYAMPLPTILMEWQPVQWQTIGKNQQKGTGSIRFYIYFENYADAFNGSINQNLALQFYEFTEWVHQALQGYFIAEKLAPLQRVSDNEDSAEDMIITSTVDYSTIITDLSTEEAKNFVMTDPAVTVVKVDVNNRPPNPTFKNGFVIPGQA